MEYCTLWNFITDIFFKKHTKMATVYSKVKMDIVISYHNTDLINMQRD